MSVSTGNSFVARLFSVALACSLLLVLGIIGPSQANAGCRLAGISIAENESGESLILSVEGTAKFNAVALEDNSGMVIVLADCELADGFQLPVVAPESSISQIEYRLTLLSGTQSVELTIRMKPGAYKGYVTDDTESGKLKFNLSDETVPVKPETAPAVEPPTAPPAETPSEIVQDVEVMWYGPHEGDPDALYRIDSIEVQPFDLGERVVVTTDKAVTPRVRKFSYPSRIVFEIEGGYLSEAVDQYLYTGKDSLISRIDILFSPRHLAGVFQLIITAPEMGSFESVQNGNVFTVNISNSPDAYAPVNPTALVAEASEEIAEPEAPSMSEGQVEPGVSEESGGEELTGEEEAPKVEEPKPAMPPK
ncbi:MAG: hypothetical protein ABIC40_04380, partial [bacterium]